MARYFTIGDIHGNFDRLDRLLKLLVQYADMNLREDKLVFTGDFTDRNLNTKEVISTLKYLKEKYEDNVIILMGNHEEFLLEYLHATGPYGTGDRWCFERNGGKETFESYCYAWPFKSRDAPMQLLVAMEKEGHYDFIKSFEHFHETDEYWFSHAPIPKPQYNRELVHKTLLALRDENPETEMTSADVLKYYENDPAAYVEAVKKDTQTLFWSWHGDAGPYKTPVAEDEFAFDHGKLAVCGHITKYASRVYDHIIYNDSGCAYDKGKLTAIELEDGKVKNKWWVE